MINKFNKIFLNIGVLAVTRSLGDSSMKEFVVGNPYTTETELTENDPFLILACDGVSHILICTLNFFFLNISRLFIHIYSFVSVKLWDVCDDQDAVNLIRDIEDPQIASAKLIEHALANFSTDNLSVIVIRFMNG